MSFSDLIDGALLKHYRSERAETYHQAKDLAQILLAVVVLLACVVVLLKDPIAIRLNVLGMIVLSLVILLMIRLGHLHIATITATLGLAALASLIVFHREAFNKYEVYLLATVNLCALFLATLLTYRRQYSYLSMGLGSIIIILHYMFRALPKSVPTMAADLDDVVVSVGLLFVAGMAATIIVNRRLELVRAMESESAQSEQHALELERSRALLDAVIDQSPIPMIIATPDGYILRLNSALLEFAGESDTTGLQPGMKLSETGVTWKVFDVSGESVPLERMPLRMSLQGVVTPGREMRFDLKDGTSKWAIQHAGPIYDTTGKMVAGFSSFADITERKAAEEALSESEEKFRNLIEHSSEAIYLLYNRKFEIINRKFEEMFGVTLEDVNATEFDFMDLVAPVSKASVEERAKRLGMGEQVEPTYEFTAITADGAEVSVEATVSYIKYRDGFATQGILRDVTERRKLEQQLSQSQKMDAVGRLAGGVAHDFNNLLTVILGYSDVLLTQELPGDATQCVENIQQAGERARSLTSQLLAFSRNQIIQPKVVEVNTLLGEHNKMLGRVLGEDITIVTKLEAKIDTVLVDPGQVEQIVMNIAVNARDAMPFGGELTIETRNLQIANASRGGREGTETGLYLALKISDNGVGMNEATRARIFEPFFTTKGRDKGTGLGLSTVYGVVKQNNGSIQVSSAPERGASFEILFPVAEGVPNAESPSVNETESLSGTETILLVEDDESVRDYLSSAIASHGYRVLTAEHGEVALRTFEERPDEVDLVVSDVVMPFMSGPELVEKLQSLRPNLKCLYVSGYTDDAIAHHGVLEDGVELMQKPFSRVALLKRIRKMLD